ncbi:hypothetical protein GCM10029978_056580 [Actinoallomurus acanthiterrae]
MGCIAPDSTKAGFFIRDCIMVLSLFGVGAPFPPGRDTITAQRACHDHADGTPWDSRNGLEQ